MAALDPTFNEYRTNMNGNLAFHCRAYVGGYGGRAYGATKRNAKKLALKRLLKSLEQERYKAQAQVNNATLAYAETLKRYRRA